MKKLLILLSILFINTIVAQEVSVELSRENIIIREIYNPLIITVENTSCEDIIVKSDDAEISKNDDGSCKFKLITKTKNRQLFLSIYKTKHKDTLLIDKKGFRVLDLPNPIPTINGLKGGQVSEKIFKTNFSLGKLGSYSEYICMNFSITECTMIIFRNDKFIGQSKNIGHRITNQTKDIMQLAKSGDDVYFFNIKCEILDTIRELDAMKFKIID